LAEQSYEHALTAARSADKARALELVILDVRSLTSVCDYFVICHGRSATHVRAAADQIEEGMKQHDIPRHHREGRAQANWIVLDYMGVVVHIFSEELRAFYELERLWGDAPRVEFAPQVPAESG
jgi:ribosome-associated protein